MDVYQPAEGFQLFGIHFAPLLLPLERRLQTFALWANCVWILSVVISPFILYYVTFHTSYWYLVVAYCLWTYLDRNTAFTTGRPLECLRNCRLFKHYVDYFPIKLIKTADLPADRNYMMVVYPHGIMSFGIIGGIGSNAAGFDKYFPGIERFVVTLNSNFYMPIAREYFLSMGGRAASESSILYSLRDKPAKAVFLVAGGASEAHLSQPGSYHILLNKRKGFVRVALKAGAPLVPVFSFGENNLCEQYTNESLLRFQETTKRLTGINPIIPKGRGMFQYTFGLMPHRKPINIVVGAPIPLPKIDSPTQGDINKYHEIFKKELRKLFEENREKYEPTGKHVELIIE